MVLKQTWEPVASPPAGGFVDSIELDVLNRYLRRQITVLTRRHSVEHVILLRVLADYHQHAVREAKKGLRAAARCEMRALDRFPLPGIRELRAVNSISSQPAWALIDWLDGDCETAERRLRDALQSCSELAAEFGHDYLTGKQLTLAVHVGRMMISQGRHREGLEHLGAVGSVVSGAQSDWPFEGGRRLAVPLEGTERVAVEHQLRKAAIRACDDPSQFRRRVPGQPDDASPDR